MCEKNETASQLVSRAYNLKSSVEAKELYRDWASSYDDTMLDGLGYLTPKNTASLLAMELSDKDSRILDVGSGTGLAGEYLARLGYSNIDGLDYSREMLAVARQKQVRGTKVYKELLHADLNEPLPVLSGTYDALICTGTFTHAHVGPGCLEELFRILSKGGLFACTVQKDVWKESGFNVEIARLRDNGIIRERHMEMGKYFDNDTEPQGWYIIWQSE